MEQGTTTVNPYDLGLERNAANLEALKPGADTTAAQTIAFRRDNMAHYKLPRTIVFGPLPKTSTGKVQKYVLRERAAKLETSGSGA